MQNKFNMKLSKLSYVCIYKIVLSILSKFAQNNFRYRLNFIILICEST